MTLAEQFSKAPVIIFNQSSAITHAWILLSTYCWYLFLYFRQFLISRQKGNLIYLRDTAQALKLLYLTPAAVRWYILSRDPSLSSCITSSLGRQILNMASVIWTNINRFTSTAKYEADRGSLNIEARKNLLLTISVKMVRVVIEYFT